MGRKVYTLDELYEIAVDIVRSLKPKGLTVGELRQVLQMAIGLLDRIVYGEPVFETESE